MAWSANLTGMAASASSPDLRLEPQPASRSPEGVTPPP